MISDPQSPDMAAGPAEPSERRTPFTLLLLGALLSILQFRIFDPSTPWHAPLNRERRIVHTICMEIRM